ncbi:MAG: hypothetical protein MUF25_09385 [Pirellulaceae bacterium]|nr:hypothetical protein [Pirellulaceae bacterium]
MAAEPIPIHSPGFPPSALDAEGRLVEDWGSVGVTLSGKGVADGPTTLQAVKLDEVVPAAQATAACGAVCLIRTAFRAPAFPSGVDVLTVRVEEARGQPAELMLGLDLPANAVIGQRTVRLGGRVVLTLPAESLANRPLRDWGYCDEATSLPGWAKPAVECDPAFRNIRAGMGGVPIVYRFAVSPKSEATVVLGLCESHWAEAGQRPLSCRVEGAAAQAVDPVARWGQDKPGALAFAARDENGDGKLEVIVRAAPGARDRNPILNAIWIFPPGESPNLERLVAGVLSGAATRYVDVGGDTDQSIYPPGKLEYRIELAAGGAQELTFFVASPGSSAPSPDTSAWTAATLRRAAIEVWRDWPQN